MDNNKKPMTKPAGKQNLQNIKKRQKAITTIIPIAVTVGWA